LTADDAVDSSACGVDYWDSSHDEDEDETSGFRLNNNRDSQWTRHDADYIIGPDGEKRTKHDVGLKGQSNAHRLGLPKNSVVNDRTYNSLKNKLKKGIVKGVAAHGTGRAEKTGNAETKLGALDVSTVEIIRKSINKNLITKLNGAVKEGKEAVVYHADGPDGSDVAVKVFKKIQEFRNRAEYITGDSRYRNANFIKKSKQQQLELWAEKEYRNLQRARTAGVTVPIGLHFKKNIIFMEFLGLEGVPWPRLKDIFLPKGHKKWKHFYAQTMAAIRRSYHRARLVHCDLSEYNLLLSKDMKVIVIDWGQAVETGHPNAWNYLVRDITRISSFFKERGVSTLSKDMAKDFILKPSSESSDLSAAKRLISQAITIGVPAYNSGDVPKCVRVYEETARQISPMLPSPLRTDLDKCIRSLEVLESADAKAWALRMAFDAAFAYELNAVPVL